MKVIIVKPFTNPYVATIKGDLESMQAIVGGYIEAVYPFDDPDVALVCNEEGKLEGLTPSRFLLNCYAPADSENFESLPDNLIQKYIDKFSAKGVRL